jgi:hypothetical protein
MTTANIQTTVPGGGGIIGRRVKMKNLVVKLEGTFQSLKEKDLGVDGQLVLRPAIIFDRKVYAGIVGETHKDVLKKADLEEIDQHKRGFVTPDGKFLDRDAAKSWLKEHDPETFEKWQKEVGTSEKLYSEDYNKALLGHKLKEHLIEMKRELFRRKVS